jgi:hypothetical protein
MAKAYDRKVRPRLFQEGDLVLKKILFSKRRSKQIGTKLKGSLYNKKGFLGRSSEIV